MLARDRSCQVPEVPQQRASPAAPDPCQHSCCRHPAATGCPVAPLCPGHAPWWAPKCPFAYSVARSGMQHPAFRGKWRTERDWWGLSAGRREGWHRGRTKSVRLDGGARRRQEDGHILTSFPRWWQLAAELQLQGLRPDLAQGWAGCSTQGAGLPSKHQDENNLLISC